MSSVEKNTERCQPFYLSPSRRKKTSAEIVSEARRSLRTLCTQRPCTPRDDQRRLFGRCCSRSAEGRPPSSFSLNARSFDPSDSRPSSGQRLSPLGHKPKLAVPPGGDLELSATCPKPPSDPLELRKGSGVRSRLLRASSLPGFPPPAQPKEFARSSDPSLEEICSPAVKRERNPQQTDPAKCVEWEAWGLSEMHCEKTIPCRPGCERDSSEKSRPGSAGVSIKAGSGAEAESKTGGTVEVESEKTVYWSSRVVPLLQELDSLAQVGAVERLCGACERLHHALEEGDLLGRKCRRRSALLKALFRLIDVGSDQLSLQLAVLILKLSVSGNNLLNIYKLIFKISRNENNDTLFQNSSVIDYLLSPLRTQEAGSVGEVPLYCVGTLKFLSGNASLLKELQDKGAVAALLELSRKLRLVDQHGPVSGHILVQLTAALRNLADLPEARMAFLSNGGLSDLCSMLQQHTDDKGVCSYTARIFSKLSSYNECCNVLAHCPGCYGVFLELLRKHQTKQDLVVRIVFTLGNLTAKSELAREQLYMEEGSLDVLLGLFQVYQSMDVGLPAPGPRAAAAEGPAKPPRQPSDVEDVLIKLIRVLANWSVDPAVGTSLAANPVLVQLLLDVLENKAIEECEELVVNAAATINNLSFYQGQNSVVRARQLPIACLMLKLLLSSNMNGMLEATRVLGNLSQSKEVRDFLLKHKVHQFFLVLLDSKNPDVCYFACGVLTNLTVDKKKRAVLRDEGAIQRLTDCLSDFGPLDWQLASLVCQTLWNLSEDGSALCFREQDAHSLLELLCLYLDKELVLQWVTKEEAREFHQACWEMEFCPVAQRLKNRIESQVSLLEPLIGPS